MLQGVATREVKFEPLPLSPRFFADRIEGVSAETSAQMVAALRDGGLLDEAGKLTSDPRCALLLVLRHELCRPTGSGHLNGA